jgi:DNA-binding NtrC family response regulator
MDRAHRPCFLVVDREYSGSISTRKLVIETAKFNVLTAYSAEEALATLRRFPAVDGIIMDAEMPEIPCPDLIHTFKQINPAMPVIIIHRPLSEPCTGADYQLDTFDPRQLLTLLQNLCPEQAEAVEKRNESLKSQEKERN